MKQHHSITFSLSPPLITFYDAFLLKCQTFVKITFSIFEKEKFPTAGFSVKIFFSKTFAWIQKSLQLLLHLDFSTACQNFFLRKDFRALHTYYRLLLKTGVVPEWKWLLCSEARKTFLRVWSCLRKNAPEWISLRIWNI